MISVRAGIGRILIGKQLLPRTGKRCQALALSGQCALISDSNVAALFAERVKKSLSLAGFCPTLITIPAGEKSKTLEQVGAICDRMIAAAEAFLVAVEEAPTQPATKALQYSAPDESASGAAAMRATAASMAAEDRIGDLDSAFDGAIDAEIGAGHADPDVVQTPVRVDKTPGRNEPCFCGSGKKYKLCHGR
jgi:hypothetical protein